MPDGPHNDEPHNQPPERDSPASEAPAADDLSGPVEPGSATDSDPERPSANESGASGESSDDDDDLTAWADRTERSPANRARRAQSGSGRSTVERQALKQRRRTVALPAAPKKKRGPLKGRVADLFRVVERRAGSSERRHARAGAYALQIILHVVRQWARDRCHEKAASLTFQTMLSIVPLMALSLAILRSSGNIDAQSSFVGFLANEFIPISTEIIAAKLSQWSDNVNLRSLGLVGLIATVLVAFVMVNSLEKTINVIWRAERKRRLAQKFIIFYATATIGPFLLGASLYQASKFGWTEGYSGLFLSLLTSFGALFMANFFLPSLRIRVGPAMLGALTSTLLWELARMAFRVYVTEFASASFSGIYGPLSMVPLWLLWIYYSWLVFLLGVEVAHVAQNLHLLQRSDRRGQMTLENEILQRVNGVTGARVMMAISANYLSGDKVMPRRVLEEIFDLSDNVLTRITDRLVKRDLIIEVEGEVAGFLPARPPGEISLGEVLGAFRSSDLELSSHHTRTQLDEIFRELERNTRMRTEEVYFDELVRGTAV